MRNNYLHPRALEGKTIKKATRMKSAKYDDEAWLKLDFTDGTTVFIEATYGGFTGESRDEFPSYFEIKDFEDHPIKEAKYDTD
jgi:hypothetical protein